MERHREEDMQGGEPVLIRCVLESLPGFCLCPEHAGKPERLGVAV